MIYVPKLIITAASISAGWTEHQNSLSKCFSVEGSYSWSMQELLGNMVKGLMGQALHLKKHYTNEIHGLSRRQLQMT